MTDFETPFSLSDLDDLPQEDGTVTTFATFTREEPAEDWPYLAMWRRVKDVLKMLPQHFDALRDMLRNEREIVENSPDCLIEMAVEELLRSKRKHLDPEGSFTRHAFVRQPSRFPDIVFCEPKTRPAFGIEVKSWNVATAEGEPTYRMTAGVGACGVPDLLVVCPYMYEFGYPERGRIVLFEPYIDHLRFVATYRNWHWRGEGKKVEERLDLRPYPEGAEEAINETGDKSGNFGRLARLPLMKPYTKYIDQIEYAPSGYVERPLHRWRAWVSPRKGT